MGKVKPKPQVKKVLPPSKATSVKLRCKSLFVRGGKGIDKNNLQDGSNYINDATAKLKHYNPNVQMHALKRIENFLQSDTQTVASEKAMRSISLGLLSEDAKLRKEAQRIVLICIRKQQIDKEKALNVVLPILLVAIANTKASLLAGTLEFLHNILDEGAYAQNSCAEIKRKPFQTKTQNSEVLTDLLIMLFQLFDEVLLSKSREYSTQMLISIIARLLRERSALSIGQDAFEYHNSNFRAYFRLFVKSLAFPSTIEELIGASVNVYLSKSKQIKSGCSIEPLVRCFAQIFDILLAMFKAENTVNEQNVLKQLMHDVCFALKVLFKLSTESSVRLTIVVVIQTYLQTFCTSETNDIAEIFNGTMIPWAVRECTQQKNVNMMKKVVLLWHCLPKVSADAQNFDEKVEASANATEIVALALKSMRVSCDSGYNEYFSHLFTTLVRQRIEAVVFASDSAVKECGKPKFFLLTWERMLYAEFPFILWKARRTLSKENITEPSQHHRATLQNIIISLWHILRLFGGNSSSGLVVTSPENITMLQKIQKGCSLLIHDGMGNLKNLLGRCGDLLDQIAMCDQSSCEITSRA